MASEAATQTMRTYAGPALRAALTRAAGPTPAVALPRLAKLTVRFGGAQCAAKPALAVFYTNELPRLYAANPHLAVTTQYPWQDVAAVFQYDDEAAGPGPRQDPQHAAQEAAAAGDSALELTLVDSDQPVTLPLTGLKTNTRIYDRLLEAVGVPRPASA
ncbi:hypothetical protein CXG81DRAFT_25764 [Caulochytrium protostelioides]|uniref:Uncharacterized protein n=1 Tax=Caulochytrium protostelioides TaxID=1555241 RepID=A0A4P9X8H9_9FUNG|nr:hypothetical protein CXG81DRAFT_25764 [Caulochytrium protostelioides]|eukprot:RKP01552.1 hypothetical protein CXG81DRAFT_25764 [Caulochytrium protostelioides]